MFFEWLPEDANTMSYLIWQRVKADTSYHFLAVNEIDKSVTGDSCAQSVLQYRNSPTVDTFMDFRSTSVVQQTTLGWKFAAGKYQDPTLWFIVC